MFASLRASSSRLAPVLPARGLSSSPRALQKTPLKPSPEYSTPLDLLTKIGRDAPKRLAAQAENWESLNALWTKGGQGLKSSGLGVKDRRHLLWALDRYSHGESLEDFLKPQKPAKKYRGWGPKVQNGVRVR